MRLFVEADSIANEKMSGIGHATLEILTTLDAIVENIPLKVTAIVPFGRKKFVKQKYQWKNVSVRQLPPGYKYVNFALTRTSFPLPIDILYGRGIYIFPNYKNWYVPFSQSITFIHDVAYKMFPDTIHPKNLSYLNANFNRWLHRTDKVVSISKQSTSEVIHEFPELRNKIKTIYLGVDTARFFPREESEVSSVLKKYRIKKDYFLVVGNIEPRKNIEHLINAYKTYADSVSSPAQLVIVGGDGWKNEKSLQRIKDLISAGYDIYRPDKYVEDGDLPALYTGTRSLICVPLHEGFGLPPVQAQACGAPVIVSDIQVFHEITTSKSTTYVDPLNETKIAIALTRTRLAQPLRRPTMKPELTWRNTVRELLLFADIMER